MPFSKAFLFLLLLGMATSCWLGSAVPKKPQQPYIYYHDAQGKDRLEPATPYSFDSVMISWINRDGKPSTMRGVIYKIAGNGRDLPTENALLIDPLTLTDDKGNNGIIDNNTCTVFIGVTKTDTDTITFNYAGNTLKSFYYNNTLIAPAAGLTAYPMVFPVIVTK